MGTIERGVAAFVLALSVLSCAKESVGPSSDSAVPLETSPPSHSESGHSGESSGLDSFDSSGESDRGDTGSVEKCDGEDNDNDGMVDEGFGDEDEDGVSDCTDDECDLELLSEEDIEAEPACEYLLTESFDPWNVEMLWEFTNAGVPSGGDGGCRVSSVVDLNRDGVSDILCVRRGEPYTYALSGEDGSVIWESSEINEDSPTVALDVEGDGYIEIAATDEAGRVILLDSEAEVVWISEVVFEKTSSSSTLLALKVTDVEGDGAPEIVHQEGILLAADGSLVARFDDEVGRTDRHNELGVADVEGDGVSDFFFEWKRFDATGSELWEMTPPDDWSSSVHPVILQGDEDDEGEVLWLTTEYAALMEPDGSLIWDGAIASDQRFLPAQPPCAGDLDGDGAREFVTLEEDALHAWNIDGSHFWSRPNYDTNTPPVGCSVFDFDLDGREEVVFSDETAFYILDGVSGEPHYEDLTWD